MPLGLIGYGFSFLVIGLWLGLKIIRHRFFPKEFLYLCSLAVSLLIYYFIFFVYLFHPGVAHDLVVGLIWVSPLFFVSLVISARRSAEQLKLIHRYYLPPLLIVAAVFFIFSSLLYGCRLPATISSLDTRRVPNVTFCAIQSMPLDNGLPLMYDTFVLNHDPKGLVLDWTIVDRPPLQMGATLPIDDFSKTQPPLRIANYYNLFSIFLQLAWIGALWGVFQQLRFRRRLQLLLLVGFCATEFFYINSIFVWPKLLAAGLALGGMAPFIGKPLNKQLVRYLPVAAVLMVLGLMSHSNVAFTLIPFAFIMLYKLYGLLKNKKLGYRYLLPSLLLALMILVPWQMYKSTIASSDRLIKYQLADVTAYADKRGTLQTIIQQYEKLTFRQWADNKIQNVKTLATGNINIQLGCPIDRHKSATACNKWRTLAFFSPLFALETYMIGVPFVIYQAARKRLDSFDKETALIIASGLAVTLLLLFHPGATVVHQGSYITMMLLFLLLGRSLNRASPRLLLALTVVQLIIFYAAWIKPFPYFS